MTTAPEFNDVVVNLRLKICFVKIFSPALKKEKDVDEEQREWLRIPKSWSVTLLGHLRWEITSVTTLKYFEI